jgi:DNA-directed RNA polymerase specialized sigma24 family protein
MTPTPSGAYVPVVERGEAIGRLPPTYAAVIELLDEDVNDDAIATRLGLDPSVVGPLIAIALAKLARLMDQ